MNRLARKILFTLLIILICVAVINGARFLFRRAVDPFASLSGRIKGNPKAEIKVIEYIDFRCGPCAHGVMWLKDFMQRHPNKIYLEVRYFPLHLSFGALDARFAQCALRQGKFWDVFEALMSRQAQWIRLPNPEAYYLEIAKEMRLDIDRLQGCWKDPDVYDDIVAVKESGRQLGVNATPTYFVNEKMVVGAKNLKDELELLLGLHEKEGSAR